MENKRNYSCSLQDFLMVSLLAWEYCDKYVTDFAAFSTVYDDPFINNAVSRVKDVQQMADLAERALLAKKVRKELEEALKQNLSLWQNLKLYINKCYPKNQQDINLSAAGSAFYNKAAHASWSSLLSLMSSGNNFVSKHEAELMSKGSMPPDFANNFKVATSNTNVMCQKFFDLEMQRNIETGDKVAAANSVYAELITMLRDGQAIFRNDPLLKKQFVFTSLLSKVKGNRAAGLRGHIYDIETGMPIIDVDVFTTDNKYSAVTGKDGRFDLTRMAAGDYVLLIQKSGYQPIERPVTVKTGTTSNLDINLAISEQLLKVA